jgi:hypothetical protein
MRWLALPRGDECAVPPALGCGGWRERLGGDAECGKAAAEPPHSKGSWGHACGKKWKAKRGPSSAQKARLCRDDNVNRC